MDLNAARLWLEAQERSLPPNPSWVWDRRSPFHPTNRAATIEAIAWILLGLDCAANLQIDLSPVVGALFAGRAVAA